MELEKKYENRIKDLLKSIAFEDDQLYETINLTEILKNRYVETSQLEAYFSQDSNCFPFHSNDIQTAFGLSNDSYIELQRLLKESSKYMCVIENDTESQIRILLENFFSDQYELHSSSKSRIIESIIDELKTITINSNGASQYQRYDKILDRIKKIILSKSKKQFINQSKSILEDLELNNIAKKISDQILKIKFNPDPAGYPRSMEKAKKRFLKNEEIVVTPVTEAEKETRINELVENIINYIIYQKAKGTIQVTISQSKKTVFINDIVIPISLLSEVINKLKNTILPSAFENINTYLTSSETEFLDEFYRKYILHLDDTHILGIENTDNFLQFLKKHKDDIKTRIQRMDSRIDSSKVPNPFNFGTNVITSIGPKILKEAPYLIYAKLMSKQFDETPTTEFDIKKQIKTINIIQNNITEKMTDQREHSQIERLVYLLSLKNIDTVENISFENNKNGTPKNAITKVMEEKVYFLGNEFYQKYMTDEEFYNRINETINLMPLSKKNKIKKQYEELNKIQKFLNYKYKDISRAIIKYIDDPFKWIEYFSKKHNVSLIPQLGVVGDGKLDNTKLGPYGIAQLLIEDEIHEYETNLINGTDIENTLFNILKVCDKAYYLSNFNYITDIKRIFIIDSTNEQQNHIICEMDALNETLMAYFNGVNENGVACFYSVQNTEEILMKSFRESHFEKLIDFKGKEYTTILTFDNPGKDQIITQNYSYAKKNIESVDDFIEKLSSGKIRLRLATSLSVEADYEQDRRKQNSDYIQKFKYRQRILQASEANELSLIGYSNADQMIENMTKEEAQQFIGIQDISDEELAFIKCVLKQKNIDNILDSIDKSLQENAVENNILINERTRLQEIMRINKEVITKKDANGNDISFNTIEDIEKYFNNNKSNFKRDHIVILEYLAIIAKKKGATELSEKITLFISFLQQVFETKKIFSESYKKQYASHSIRTFEVGGNGFVPAAFNAIDSKTSLTFLDSEMIRKKSDLLSTIEIKLNQVSPTISEEDKIKYLELADRELSSVIEIEDSKAKKTKFDTAIEQAQTRLSEKIQQEIAYRRHSFHRDVKTISTVTDISIEEKVARIFNEATKYIKDVNLMRENFQFEANDIIYQYHFDSNANTMVTEYESHKYDIFDNLLEQYCNIKTIVDELLSQLKMELTQLYDRYVETGGILYEYEVRDLDNALNYRKKQTLYLEMISNKVRTYTISIYKLYDYLIGYNAAFDDSKKTAIREIIETSMRNTRNQIMNHTNKSSIFSLGTAELVRYLPYNNGMYEQDDQIARIEQSTNPTNSFRI